MGEMKTDENGQSSIEKHLDEVKTGIEKFKNSLMAHINGTANKVNEVKTAAAADINKLNTDLTNKFNTKIDGVQADLEGKLDDQKRTIEDNIQDKIDDVRRKQDETNVDRDEDVEKRQRERNAKDAAITKAIQATHQNAVTNINLLGDQHNGLAVVTKDMGQDLRKVYEQAYATEYGKRATRAAALACAPKNKFSVLTEGDLERRNFNTNNNKNASEEVQNIEFKEDEKQSQSQENNDTVHFGANHNQSIIANLDQALNNQARVDEDIPKDSTEEQNDGQSDGSFNSRRRLATTAKPSPSERVLQRRRLASRPKTHLCVLEALLEDIQTLH